jgi:hypothetical protein
MVLLQLEIVESVTRVSTLNLEGRRLESFIGEIL